MPNSIWIYSVRRRHVSTQPYKPGKGRYLLTFNSNSNKTVKPQCLVNHVAVAPAEQQHLITPRVINNYSSGSINVFCTTEALAVEHKQSQRCTNDMNAGAIGQVECCRRGSKQVTGWYIPLGLSSSMVTMVAGGPGRESLHSIWAERRKKVQLNIKNHQ